MKQQRNIHFARDLEEQRASIIDALAPSKRIAAQAILLAVDNETLRTARFDMRRASR